MEDFVAFTFDSNRYSTPDVSALITWLHDRHMKHVFIVDCTVPAILSENGQTEYHPYVSLLNSSAYVVHPAGDLPLFNIQWPPVPVAWPDWTNPAIDHWLQENIELWSQGIGIPDGIWLDMNEPSAFCEGQITHSCTRLYDNRTHIQRHGKLRPKPLTQQNRVVDPQAVPHPQVNLPSDLPYPPYLPGNQHLEAKSFNISSFHTIGRHLDVKSMWGSFEQKAFNAALLRLRNKRAFTLSRANFMGSGRHGAHWLGDNDSDAKSMAFSVGSTIVMGMFGISMIGADICGFGGNTTPELCARWMQLGTMYPFSRNHNSGSVDQEAYRFGEPYLSMNRNSLNLRYSLLPYFYTLFAQSHMIGLPVWRALSWEFPQDSATWSIDQQAMIGSALLMTPIVNNTVDESVIGYMPRGDWFDYHTFARVQPGYMKFVSAFNVSSWVPLLIRGGYIVPTQIPQLTTYDTWTQPYILRVALDSNTNDARGQVVIDDGETINAIELNLINRLEWNAHLYLSNELAQVMLIGTITSTITNMTKAYPLDAYIVQRVYVLGLDIDASAFNITAQTVCIISGSGQCRVLTNVLTLTGSGAIALNTDISMAQPFTVRFGSSKFDQHEVVTFA